MWLLSTARAELRFFASPEGVPGGFAILSHVWLSADEEDTFQAVQAYTKECLTNATATGYAQGPPPHESPLPPIQPEPRSVLGRSQPTNPRDLVSPKIRQFLALAEAHGHEWAWADTCCIDKTSSAELTEAINSMFRYYQHAEVCYVYLRDVPADDDPAEPYSAFDRSRWHTRGWTLQELLAPPTVVFLSQTWTVLGDKFRLASTLTRITQIPESVLRLEKDVAEMSVAQRMSWAAERETTRVEDRAYCLFGLFGINMPTLYGEGSNAFYRLQEEILRTSVDASLFTWPCTYSTLAGPWQKGNLSHALPGVRFVDPYLFARSPSVFVGGSDIRCVGPGPGRGEKGLKSVSFAMLE